MPSGLRAPSSSTAPPPPHGTRGSASEPQVGERTGLCVTAKGPRGHFGEGCPGVSSRLRPGADCSPLTAQGPWTATRSRVRAPAEAHHGRPLAAGSVPSASFSSPATAFHHPRTGIKVPFRRPAPSTNVALPEGPPVGHSWAVFSRGIWQATPPRVHDMRVPTKPEDLAGFE